MYKIFVLFSILMSGCGVLTLNPHGKSSICADNHPTLQGSVVEAVDYWKNAGLTNLDACSSGSIELEIVEPMLDKSAYTSETNDGIIHIKIEKGVLDWVKDDRLWVRKFASTVIAHELGHALGLPHTTNEASVMYPTSSVLESPVNVFDREWAQELLQGKFPDGPDSIRSSQK